MNPNLLNFLHQVAEMLYKDLLDEIFDIISITSLA